MWWSTSHHCWLHFYNSSSACVLFLTWKILDPLADIQDIFTCWDGFFFTVFHFSHISLSPLFDTIWLAWFSSWSSPWKCKMKRSSTCFLSSLATYNVNRSYKAKNPVQLLRFFRSDYISWKYMNVFLFVVNYVLDQKIYGIKIYFRFHSDSLRLYMLLPLQLWDDEVKMRPELADFRIDFNQLSL